MSPEDRDHAWLWDMLDAARTARDLAAESSRESFLSDRRTQLAVWKCLEFVGEAARRVSRVFKDQHPEIPWSEIIGQRHVLVHDYHHVNLARIWRVVQNDVPTLIEQLEPLAPDPPSDPEE